MQAALSGWSLRTRLVVLVTALVAIALAIAGFAAVAALRSYLLAEVDRGLVEVTERIAHGPGQGQGQPNPDPAQITDQPGQDVGPTRPSPVGRESIYLRISDASGTVHTVPNADETTDPPVLPELTAEQAQARAGVAYTVSSQSGDSRWRAMTVPFEDGSGSVTAATDVSGISATVTRLMMIELAIGALVLLALGVAAWLLVRRSLRPLDDVEHAAAAIAGGDLTHRAPGADPRTEVGSLALSFNTMVDSLQGALTAQALSERAARESESAARASESRMRQFVADASHELRTPLTSVRGFAELYRIGAVPSGPPLDDAMSRIEAESARMGVLVEDMLLLARLDQHRPMDTAEVDLLELVADAVAGARAAAPDRDVRIDVDPDGPEPIVSGDALRLRQVVDNLLSNALRYSPDDQPVLVRVRVDDTDEHERWAVLDVADRGPGLSQEQAQRVFERFYRADPARSRELGGAGLGLAIVASITAAHGGLVDLLTAPGEGAVFRVRLPLAGAAATIAE